MKALSGAYDIRGLESMAIMEGAWQVGRNDTRVVTENLDPGP